MISALRKYMPTWLMGIIAAALALAMMVGSGQDSASAINPDETDIAYVADGYNFPDALMGATLAGLNTAPMLGVRGPSSGDTVPSETAAELDRLTNDKANKLDTIYVFGGAAAVSDKVVGDLGTWANNVARIAGDNRFATMKEISEALPSKVKDSDLLDGKDSSQFLRANAKAADSDLLDGKDSGDFLGKTEQAADADTVDGLNSPDLQLPAAVPAGKTMRGGYTLDTETSGSGDYGIEIAFPVPLGSAPPSGNMHFIPEGGSPPAECPGDASSPQADPGHICIYEYLGSGAASYAIGGATPFDALVWLNDDTTAGDLYSYGTWAYTEPAFSSSSTSAESFDLDTRRK